MRGGGVKAKAQPYLTLLFLYFSPALGEVSGVTGSRLIFDHLIDKSEFFVLLSPPPHPSDTGRFNLLFILYLLSFQHC